MRGAITLRHSVQLNQHKFQPKVAAGTQATAAFGFLFFNPGHLAPNPLEILMPNRPAVPLKSPRLKKTLPDHELAARRARRNILGLPDNPTTPNPMPAKEGSAENMLNERGRESVAPSPSDL